MNKEELTEIHHCFYSSALFSYWLGVQHFANLTNSTEVWLAGKSDICNAFNQLQIQHHIPQVKGILTKHLILSLIKWNSIQQIL